MKTTITKEDIRKMVESYLKGRNVNKSLTPYEYSGLRNFVSKNAKKLGFERISNEKLLGALSSLGIEVRK